MRQEPTPTQAAFLLRPEREALYGGAAGGGKSSALLLAALQYVDVPGYSALILRRTYADLSKPGALMDRAHEWLEGTGATWNQQDKQWTFPSGARLSFGHLETERDKYNYQGAEYQYVGFDELTQFTSSQYRYLFSRVRRLKGSNVPIRVRAASNPGGVGHEWVYQRFFVEGATKGRAFVPARLEDNPHLDQEEYRASLAELDPVTRRQLEKGDWEVREAGEYFDRATIAILATSPCPPVGVERVRFWDLAATEAAPGTDPDWTVGVRLARFKGQVVVEDVQRARLRPHLVEALVEKTAKEDGPGVQVRMEQEGGSSGKGMIDHYARNVIPGAAFLGVRSTGDKVTRAKPFSAACANRRVSLMQAEWNGDFLDELEAFPMCAHDDQVDAAAGAFNSLHDAAAPGPMSAPARETSPLRLTRM